MDYKFNKIGLITKHQNESLWPSLKKLVNIITKDEQLELILDADSAKIINDPNIKSYALEDLTTHIDLAIILGGDGTFLKAARHIADDHTPIIGVNYGRLGFLADIAPVELETSLKYILQGNYYSEYRTLIAVNSSCQQQINNPLYALNDCILYNGHTARMFEFDLYIDEQHINTQAADGFIIATPTGSTAYALSSGGPIVHPNVNALVLLPMYPHNLTSRPIIVPDNSKIKLSIPDNSNALPKFTCDSQIHLELKHHDTITITKSPKKLHLIHPKNHNYFKLLQNKLGWNNKQGN